MITSAATGMKMSFDKSLSNDLVQKSAEWLGAGIGVQSIAQIFSGLEERHVFLFDLDGLARPRVAADAGSTRLDRKCPKAAKLDPISA